MPSPGKYVDPLLLSTGLRTLTNEIRKKLRKVLRSPRSLARYLFKRRETRTVAATTRLEASLLRTTQG
jgi:hypothetical protein